MGRIAHARGDLVCVVRRRRGFMSRQEVIIRTLGLPRTSQTISLRPSHAGTLLETPYRCPPDCNTFTGLLFHPHVRSSVAAWLRASRDASFFGRLRDNSNCAPLTQFGGFPKPCPALAPCASREGKLHSHRRWIVPKTASGHRCFRAFRPCRIPATGQRHPGT
jgi:hypothetical protein